VTEWPSQKHKTRTETVQRVLLRVHPNDRHVWEFIADVLRRLGTGGMSSDESDIDGPHGTVYRVHFLPWRNAEFAQIAEAVDQVAASDQPRRRRTPRIRPSNPMESKRSPVSNLPYALYNDQWLRKFSREHLDRVLSISKEQFMWLRLIHYDYIAAARV
jgi:hypothetical protein